jgi:hypothetical protein
MSDIEYLPHIFSTPVCSFLFGRKRQTADSKQPAGSHRSGVLFIVPLFPVESHFKKLGQHSVGSVAKVGANVGIGRVFE